MSLIKKEMNLILNNMRNLKEHEVGSELLEDPLLDKLIDQEFEEYISKSQDKVTKAALRKILSKCLEVKKLLKFSKTQILYDKNLRLMQAAKDDGALDGCSIMHSGKF
jgi:hypothetical protein